MSDDTMIPCMVCGKTGHWESSHAKDFQQLTAATGDNDILSGQLQKSREETAAAKSRIAELEKELTHATGSYVTLHASRQVTDKQFIAQINSLTASNAALTKERDDALKLVASYDRQDEAAGATAEAVDSVTEVIELLNQQLSAALATIKDTKGYVETLCDVLSGIACTSTNDVDRIKIYAAKKRDEYRSLLNPTNERTKE